VGVGVAWRGTHGIKIYHSMKLFFQCIVFWLADVIPCVKCFVVMCLLDFTG